MSAKLKICFIVSLFLTACGEGTVRFEEQSFQPKIVIQGWLFPNQPVNNIKISRNFPINSTIAANEIIVRDAHVTLLDAGGLAFGLTFDERERSYRYSGTDLVIRYGETYTLEVAAAIAGRQLFAKSTTTVPNPGFRIEEEKSQLGSMQYRERTEDGELNNFNLVFQRSPGSDFYALSLTALDAEPSTFIYDNPFGDFDSLDVKEDFDDFKFSYTWIQNTPLETGESNIEVFWFFTWFYSRYQAVLYAGDDNFKDFLITHNEVQEIDGNFHEPSFHIQGDGIGLFASAIADTVFFSVTR
ncbi:MAG: DUF4249 family protein [bacterium]